MLATGEVHAVLNILQSHEEQSCMHVLCSLGFHPAPGLDHEWSLEKYGELLEIGGGKERMDAYFSVRGPARHCFFLSTCTAQTFCKGCLLTLCCFHFAEALFCHPPAAPHATAPVCPCSADHFLPAVGHTCLFAVGGDVVQTPGLWQGCRRLFLNTSCLLTEQVNQGMYSSQAGLPGCWSLQERRRELLKTALATDGQGQE
jgi:hypothetical protein